MCLPGEPGQRIGLGESEEGQDEEVRPWDATPAQVDVRLADDALVAAERHREGHGEGRQGDQGGVPKEVDVRSFGKGEVGQNEEVRPGHAASVQVAGQLSRIMVIILRSRHIISQN